MMIENNGHTAVVTLENLSPTVSGGLLGDEYTLAQFHFHWGSVDTQGSEHTDHNVEYPAELHLVHYRTAYGSLANAVGYSKGLAVLGVFLTVSLLDNPALTPITEMLSHIPAPGDKVALTSPFPVGNLLPTNTNAFYRYDGSLTTPTCNEVVAWTVFKEPIKISSAQLEEFRSLLGHDGVHHLEDNYRPPQNINGRPVFDVTLGANILG